MTYAKKAEPEHERGSKMRGTQAIRCWHHLPDFLFKMGKPNTSGT